MHACFRFKQDAIVSDSLYVSYHHLTVLQMILNFMDQEADRQEQSSPSSVAPRVESGLVLAEPEQATNCKYSSFCAIVADVGCLQHLSLLDRKSFSNRRLKLKLFLRTSPTRFPLKVSFLFVVQYQ